MRRSLIRPLAVIALLALAAWALFHQLRPKPLLVVVQRVERGWVESTVANTRAGTVEACRRAKLAPQMSGQIERLPVAEGDRVRKGEVLRELWNDDLRSQLALAESERARASCEAARAMAEESGSRVAVARAALDKTILVAPFDGVVSELNGELGEMVTPSPPGIPTLPAVDLIEEGCLLVSAPIDEIDGRSVRAGHRARVTLDAFPGRRFDGTVRRVAPYVLDVEKQARTIEVEVEIDDPSSIPALVPGYSADVEILLERKEDVLRVPAEALSGENRVLVLRDGIIEERPIETGVANWQFVEVVSGLELGEEIVLSLDRPGVEAGARAEAEAVTVP